MSIRLTNKNDDVVYHNNFCINMKVRKAIITALVLNTNSFFKCQSGKLKKKNRGRN